ncbi:DUF1659 domain-containing protein [Acetobacterium wieringae]|uniref:DUF1659 domain-containing protein n=1 Tax=Acetobacterium wieringae TaxID=52694 RepID=A0ABY6H9X3_9FIRM|nr:MULTISPECIES: DUF1659 domain-containing protein [Acetobacterium]OXS25667.1 MAG: hypothetical protein BI182_00715 [Acetobacterium sp. MES1]UYO61263.1 DUF1659 domain-containing protein [Acetobacterium wieringae]VUZ29071.1 Uncharacterised protein [Acetobacterium wieringae]
MALTSDFLTKKVQIRSNHGIVDGKEKITTRTYGDIVATATDQAIYDTALIIDGLQQPMMEEVIKHDLSLLTMI